ncbi:MAG: hypothetical protein ACKV2T_03580 [Kofleriaceae bacterium]
MSDDGSAIAASEGSTHSIPSAIQSAAREFLDGPSLRDAIRAGTELAGTENWLAPEPSVDAARGHGLDATGWMRARFGLANP